MRGLLLGLPLLMSLSGCNTFNGAIDGFERDVDRFAAQVDRWSDEFLPDGGPGPQQYQPTHFQLPETLRPRVAAAER